MRLVVCGVSVVAALAAAAAAAASPTPVTAWYMYGSSASALQSYAYARGCDFAEAQPGTSIRVLLLDFGAARKLDSSTWGAVDFSNTRFSNAAILAALERAADGYHNCHRRGGVDIAYGNSNYHLSGSGMSGADAWYAGYHQAERSEDLADYQGSHGYTSQTSEFKPARSSPRTTPPTIARLAPDGSVDGPCNNGWDVSDVGYVSFHGLALPLPEIYYSANAHQWTVVRKWWAADYFFAGVTASTGVGLAPASAWSLLDSLNSGLVDPELVCFGC